ncbi:MAG: hypothetical protein ABIW30_05190 [Arenimonas sp.]
MSTPFPPTEALDERERELARIVRALPGGDPPLALDARILKSAANAAAASRRPGARWLGSAGALWGIGGAAAAVLALGVGWQMKYAAPRPSQMESAPAAAMADQTEDSSVPVGFSDAPTKPTELAAPSPRVATAPSRRPPAPTGGVAVAPAPLPQPFADGRLDERVTAGADANDSVGSAAPPAVAQRRESSPAAQRRQANTIAAKAVASEPEAQGRYATAAAAAPAAQAGVDIAAGMAADASSPSFPNSPATWLTQIRRLRDEGRTLEARASLLEFHRRHPHNSIPSDLVALLRANE